MPQKPLQQPYTAELQRHKWPNSLISKWAVEAMVIEDTTAGPIATAGGVPGGANRWRQPDRLLARL